MAPGSGGRSQEGGACAALHARGTRRLPVATLTLLCGAGLLAAVPAAAARDTTPSMLAAEANPPAAPITAREPSFEIRLAQTQTGAGRKAAAADLVVLGPIRAAAGHKAALPLRLASETRSGGRYVVVLNAPAWLSFGGGEQIGSGVWLIERSALAKAEATFSSNASGSQDLKIGLGGKTGAIESVVAVRVEVEPAAITTGAIGSEAAGDAAPVIAPAPVPALRFAEAQNAASGKPQQQPAEIRTAQAQGQPGGAGSFTWERLISGDKPAAGPKQTAPTPAAPPAAAAGSKSEAELIQEAKHLVRECTTCHNLYGSDVGIPVMVGLTVDRFLDTMDLYKREKRDHKLMQVIAKSLTDEETRALALYLSRIKPAPQEAAGSAGTAASTAQSAADAVRAAQEPAQINLKRASDDKTRERIARWLQRGEAMLNAGDIAQARLLLQRASEYGDPRAAFLMATSFDPNALPWAPGIGMVAEPLTARRWYLLAKSLGGGGDIDTRLADLPAPQ